MMSEDVDVSYEHFDRELVHSSFLMCQEMRETGEFCDVTIKIGPHSFPAHRVVLATGIPYFRAMFRHNFAESKIPEITMTGVDPNALRSLINFAYSGKLQIGTVTVDTILSTAIYLQMKRAIDACFLFLLEHLRPESVLSTRAHAKSLGYWNEVEFVDHYVCKNFCDVSKSEAFLNFPFSMLKELIARDDLVVTSEEIVREAVVTWVKANEAERNIHLPELMSHVRTLSHATFRSVLDEELPSTSESSGIYGEQVRQSKFYDDVGSAVYYVSLSPQSWLIANFISREKEYVALPEGRGFQFLDTDGDSSYLVSANSKFYFLRFCFMGTLCLKNLGFAFRKCDYWLPEKAGVTLHNHSVYFFGGFGRSSSNQVLCLNPELATCTEAGTMTTNRVDSGVASIGDNIFVTGGRNPIHSSNEYSGPQVTISSRALRSAEKYNPLTQESVEISQMLHGRKAHGCSALNAKVYVCGGYGIHQEALQSVEVYDTLTDKWNCIGLPLCLPRETAVCSLVSNSDKLYGFFRQSTTEEVTFIKEYDPTEEKWKGGFVQLRPSNSYKWSLVVATETALVIR